MRNDRAISSVADVSLAIVIIIASLAVFAAFLGSDESVHDPTTPAQTTDTLGAATFNVTYSLADVLETDSEYIDPVEAYGDDLNRSTHGTALAHLARGALANATVERDGQSVRPFSVGPAYADTVEKRLQTALVSSQYETSVTARWEPFEGASLFGAVQFGPTPPPESERTLIRTTVASELPAARENALAATQNGTAGYGAVADAVAAAIVNGTFADAQREIESGGVEHAVTLSRYLRFADAVGTDRSYSTVTPSLDRSHIDTDAMNAQLVAQLAEQFEPELEAFDTPTDAAAAVSTGEITLSITTWDR